MPSKASLKRLAVFFVICLICLTLYFLPKIWITSLLEKEFEGECFLKKITLLIDTLTLEDLILNTDYMQVKAKEITIHLFLSTKLPGQIRIRDAWIEVKDLPKLRKKILSFLSKKSEKPIALPSLLINFKNIGLDVNDASIKGGLNLSFKGYFRNGSLKDFEDINVKISNFELPELSFSSLSMDKISDLEYLLKVEDLNFKDKRVPELKIPFVLGDRLIMFEKTTNDIIGTYGYATGLIDYSDFRDLRLILNFDRVSVYNVVKFLRKEEDVVFTGQYKGALQLHFDKLQFQSIEGKFTSLRGGKVNVKKETSLEFLQRYLDQRSYKVLIDSLKNYLYNRGEIIISQESNGISLNMGFDSDNMGRRDISVSFHR